MKKSKVKVVRMEIGPPKNRIPIWIYKSDFMAYKKARKTMEYNNIQKLSKITGIPDYKILAIVVNREVIAKRLK